MATLEVRDLHVSVSTDEGPIEILRGVDLTIASNETHAIMGPNGSGKSTLAYSLAGHPKYRVTRGTVTLDGENVLTMTVDQRARAGLFLAMQYPVEVPGGLDLQLPAHRGDRGAWAGARDPQLGQGGQGRHDRPGHRPGVRRALGERGLLRWREEAARDPPAVAVEAEDRHSGRDGFRAGCRRTAGGGRGRQPLQGGQRRRHPAHHPLHPDPAVHPSRPV